MQVLAANLDRVARLPELRYSNSRRQMSRLRVGIISELKEQLEISDRCVADFGEHAVMITNGKEFFRRVNETIRRNGYRVSRGLVKYYRNIHPALESDLDGAFHKREKYSYQREYRIAIATGTVGQCPLVLDIGDITDITVYVRTQDINKGLQIHSK